MTENQCDDAPATQEELENEQASNQRKILAFYKKLSNVIGETETESEGIAAYQQALTKQNVDLRSDIDSSIAIHILMKPEKSKFEQAFIKNAISNLQLFQKHKDLLSSGSHHLFTQMKVEFFQKCFPIFHYGDYGQKYYILLKGDILYFPFILQLFLDSGEVDLLMPGSQYVEQNNYLISQYLQPIPYFDKNIMQISPEESFEQFIERSYSKMNFIKTFKAGEAFGEIALMTNQPRTGSIIAREDSLFLVITKQGFHELLGKVHELMQFQKLNFLQQFFFFKNVNNAKFLSIIQFMKIFKYKRNNVLYDEKQVTEGIYFIKEGEVCISTNITDHENPDDTPLMRQANKVKQNQKVVIKATNSFFGEEEIVLDLPFRRSKATCASESCEVYLFSKDILNNHCKQFQVIELLKESFLSKKDWEEERNVKIKNVQKQNEDNINLLNYTKIKNQIRKSSVSFQFDQFTQNQQVNNDEVSVPIELPKTLNRSRSHRFSQSLDPQQREQKSFSPQIQENDQYKPNQQLPSFRMKKMSIFMNKDMPSSSIIAKKSEDNDQIQAEKIPRSSLKTQNKPKMQIFETFRQTKNNTSIENQFYDSTHQKFESMLKQEAQAKQYIFSQISSKQKPIQPMEAFADVENYHKDFRIVKKKSTVNNYVDKRPQEQQQNATMKSSFLIKQDDEILDSVVQNSTKSQLHPQEKKLNYLHKKTKSLSMIQIQQGQQAMVQNWQLEQFDNPGTQGNIFSQTQRQVNLQQYKQSTTFNHLDFLFEAQGENNIQKMNKKQNDEEMDSKIKILKQKFLYGKNVAEFISKKGQYEKALSLQPIFPATQAPQFEEFQNSKFIPLSIRHEFTQQLRNKEAESLKHHLPDFGMQKDPLHKKIINLHFNPPSSSQRN